MSSVDSNPQKRLWTGIDNLARGVKAYDKATLYSQKDLKSKMKQLWAEATCCEMKGADGGTYLVNKRSLQKFMERNKPFTNDTLHIPP